MANVRMKWNTGALHELRSSPGPVGELERLASRVHAIASADGGKFLIGSQQGASRPQGRWRTSVAVGDRKAARINAKHHSLLRGLGSVGGT
ncbi:hypothetical protein [Rhodococcus erythropolis]|uniref:hypothetical protein n=1 Tax=Rhodococcus erythropolis TaxID=1833 RepID=UPI001BE6EF5F|nr:hypothetical protein [Rhodococcus erythropolis]MBT2266452.1 hypothetical protein [Rhodococcus erythropolis]